MRGSRLGRPRRPHSTIPRDQWAWPYDELRVSEHRGKIEVAIVDAAPGDLRRATALRITYERARALVAQLQTLLNEPKAEADGRGEG